MSNTAGSPVVLITPIMPALSGNGLAMRAGMMLQALAVEHDVHLLLVPVAGRSDADATFAAPFCQTIKIISPTLCLDPLAGLVQRVLDPGERWQARLAYPRPWMSRLCSGVARQEVTEWLRQIRPAAVHVMRLYLAPLVQPLLDATNGRPLLVLDLDDDDASVHRNLAELAKEPNEAALLRAEANKLDLLADEMLHRFDRVLLSAPEDLPLLHMRSPGAVLRVVPNGYPTGVAAADTVSSTADIRLLYVGSAQYLPNRDAAAFLCQEIAPMIRALTHSEVTLTLAGADPDGFYTNLADQPGIRAPGQLADLAPLLRWANIATAPLRAGGGSRIKILEAFAHGLPVVSTTIGARGLQVQSGMQLLLADTAAQFAASCIQLHLSPELRRQLSSNAAQYHQHHHTPQSVAAALRLAYSG